MEQSVIVGLISFLLGLFLGHRLSLGRDRRKEFNETTKTPYLALCAQIKNRTLDRVYIPLPVIEPYICLFARRRFRDIVHEYESGNYNFGDYNPATGSVVSEENEIDRLIEVAKNVRAFIKPR
jgi:hypothetical protein